jgi:hypothetical protein
MEPETLYARSGDVRIACQVMGAGPDLVVAPGLTSHLEIQWRDLSYRRFMRSLSSFCRLRFGLVLTRRNKTSASHAISSASQRRTCLQPSHGLTAGGGVALTWRIESSIESSLVLSKRVFGIDSAPARRERIHHHTYTAIVRGGVYDVLSSTGVNTPVRISVSERQQERLKDAIIGTAFET